MRNARSRVRAAAKRLFVGRRGGGDNLLLIGKPLVNAAPGEGGPAGHYGCIRLDLLEVVLGRETSVIDPEDVEPLMETLRVDALNDDVHRCEMSGGDVISALLGVVDNLDLARLEGQMVEAGLMWRCTGEADWAYGCGEANRIDELECGECGSARPVAGVRS